MAQLLKDWVATHVKDMGKIPDEEIFRVQFYRNPHRTIHRRENIMYSSADGVIINQVMVNNLDDQIMEIKGRKFSLRNALAGKQEDLLDKIEKAGGALVIDIFMTYYDVHYNRMPTDGFLEYERMEQVESYNNSPMLDVEENLFRGKFKDSVKNIEYMFCNERVLNKIYSPRHKMEYYVIQIADDMINCIQPAYIPYANMPNKKYYSQCDLFGNIRKGSQNTIIVPFNENYELKPLLEPGYHVEAGIDEIVELVPKS